MTNRPVPDWDVAAAGFDIDGTLWLEGHPLPGARKAVETARATGLAVVFLTNTSGRTRGEVAAALRGAGFAAVPDNVWTSASVAAQWLATRRLRRVVVLGTTGLVTEMREHGLTACSLAQADGRSADECFDALVVGLDRDWTSPDDISLPESLRQDVARRRTLLVACNRDQSFPGAEGPRPGCGVFLARVESLCRRQADVVAGKPATTMVELAAAALGVEMRQLLVVGDSWEADVGMARAAGCPWALLEMQAPAGGHAMPGGTHVVAARVALAAHAGDLGAGVGDADAPGGVVLTDLVALASMFAEQSRLFQ